jgi:hypothetical protein
MSFAFYVRQAAIATSMPDRRRSNAMAPFWRPLAERGSGVFAVNYTLGTRQEIGVFVPGPDEMSWFGWGGTARSRTLPHRHSARSLQ